MAMKPEERRNPEHTVSQKTYGEHMHTTSVRGVIHGAEGRMLNLWTARRSRCPTSENLANQNPPVQCPVRQKGIGTLPSADSP